ncbi:MAG: DUF177 domain-containing protein [Gemmatimonadaceae bacterium]|nr:DUF177 domain-containing protein [Gemmatimonadaceae bacterium]
MAMLSFDIRALDARAAIVDGWLSPDDAVWQDGDDVPVDPVHVTGRLSRAGADRFYWSGRIEGRAGILCRRCLVPLTAPVAENVNLIFSESLPDDEDDPDVFQIGPRAREIDLRPAVREQWLLGVPNYAVCRDDCAGICPRCGADVNTGACECPPETDSRLDALKSLRSESN